MNIQVNEILAIIIRSFVSFFLLFFVTKIIGKKQVSELSLFDYVIGISIGNFAAEMTMNLDNQYLNGVVALFIFGLIAYVVAIITMKNMNLRRFFIGTPTIIIQNGKIIEKNMKNVKIDINDLLEQCRTNGYFDLTEIEYAIMEANGRLSIMPKAEYKPLTPKDSKTKVQKQVLLGNVLIDGNIMLNNLKIMGKTKEWLVKELKVKGYQNYENIILATLDNNDKITVYEKNNAIKVNDILE